MKKAFIILILILTITNTAQAAQKIKINGGISNGSGYIKTSINCHKIAVRTPKLSKNKYLKLVNIGL